ncbi:MAG: hypothetical protein ACYTG2_10330 [Planctomycetota bacterium]
MKAALTLVVTVALSVLSAAGAARAQDPDASSCATNCHTREATSYALSVHADVLGCVDCHGGDPSALRDKEASHSPAAGFRGTPDRTAVPEQCGECHADPGAMFATTLPTDQLARYRTSAHGRAVLERGDTQAAVCTDCHTAHAVAPISDPNAPTSRTNLPGTCARCHADAEHMQPYGLPTDIVAEFEQSVHGQALLVDRLRGAPTCTDCHSSHGIAPPGVDSTVQVCSHCHATTGEWYLQSPHAGSAAMSCTECHPDEPGFERADCSACHGAHAIAEPGAWMFSGDEPGHCGHCHREPDASADLAAAILGGTQRLEQAMHETGAQLVEAKQHGLFIDNERIHERESARVLVSLQPLAHSLDTAAIERLVQDGVRRQDRTLEALERQRIALRDRRLLAGGVAFVLLMLTGLLAVKLDAVRKLS